MGYIVTKDEKVVKPPVVILPGTLGVKREVSFLASRISGWEHDSKKLR